MTMIGFDKTRVVAATGIPDFRLGSVFEYDDVSNGMQKFVYGRANGAITGAAYVCVEQTGFDFALATLTTTAPGSSGPGCRVGVACAVLADNEFGWFQIYGKGPVRTAASAAKGTRLNSTATGGVVDDDGTASSEQILGIVLLTATGGAEATNADATLSYPVVGVTL